jgi:hypothetical protein
MVAIENTKPSAALKVNRLTRANATADPEKRIHLDGPAFCRIDQKAPRSSDVLNATSPALWGWSTFIKI